MSESKVSEVEESGLGAKAWWQGLLGVLLIGFGWAINWALALIFVLTKIQTEDLANPSYWLMAILGFVVLPVVYAYLGWRHGRKQMVWSAYLLFLRRPLHEFLRRVVFGLMKSSVEGQLNKWQLWEKIEERSERLFGMVPGPAGGILKRWLFSETFKASLQSALEQVDWTNPKELTSLLIKELERRLSERFKPSLSFLTWLLPLEGVYALLLYWI